MSIAKQCDICGKFYELYNIRNDGKNTNGLMFLNIDRDMKYFAHDPIDCCPNCMDLIRRYVDYMKTLGKEKE